MTARERDGFALLTALWALAVVGALAGVYLAESRSVVQVAHNRNVLALSEQAALAGLARAHNALERLQALAGSSETLGPADRADLHRIWNRLDSAFVPIAQECLGPACYEMTVRDLGTTLDINTVDAARMRRLLLALDVDYRVADVAAQSLADWLDADDLHRARGAERQYYQALTFPREPRNGPIPHVEELLKIRGFDRRLYELVRPYLSVDGDGRINVNAAPTAVLATLPGLSEIAVRGILRARARGLVFQNPFEIARLLPAEDRARLRASYAEFVRNAAFEPQRIEVRSRGYVRGAGPEVRFRALYVRARDRITLVKRVRETA